MKNVPSRGQFLGRNPDKSLEKFLLAFHSQFYRFAFYFCKLAQPLTISTVQEKGGKLDRKPYKNPKSVQLYLFGDRVRHRVHTSRSIYEIGGVYLLSQLERTLQFCM